MLILAQPKSISTSILHGISLILSVDPIQEFKLVGEYGSVEEYKLLPHSDMINAPHELLEKWVVSSDIYKQHLPPTNENVSILEKIGKKIVVLTRNPEDTYQAYLRSHTGKLIADPANEKEVKRQINFFYRGLKDKIENNSKFDSLFLDYVEIAKDNPGIVNKILEFWGFSVRVPSFYELPKMRYTRVSKYIPNGEE